MSKKRVDWKKKVKPFVLELLANNPVWRFPSIRSVYYVLSDTYAMIPATVKAYKTLDDHIVDMRKGGQIPFGRFKNYRGVSSHTGSWAVDIEYSINKPFKDLLEIPEEFELPYLWKQDTLIEIWVEKKGLMESFIALAGQEYGIEVRCCEGFSPWEFVNLAVEDMRSMFKQRSGERLEILYFGDLDPSGISIGETLENQIKYFYENIDFKRLGVDLEHVSEYGLPNAPESPETLKKIRNDSRYNGYIKRFGEVFCELDSFISLRPDEFKGLLQNEIEDRIDKDKVKEKDRDEEIFKERLNDLLELHKDELQRLNKQMIEDWNNYRKPGGFRVVYKK